MTTRSKSQGEQLLTRRRHRTYRRSVTPSNNILLLIITLVFFVGMYTYLDNIKSISRKIEVLDKTPPIIEGAKDLFVFEGDTISYRKDVVVKDNLDNNIELVIDNSQVNLQKPGEYTLTYHATDGEGNTSSQEVIVTVMKKLPSSVEEEEMFATADQVLSEIIDESMSKKDKAWYIYDWVINHISYSSQVDKTDWILGAQGGFKTRKGDCFTYFSVTKALLTRAGISNLDVTRVGGRSDHYWHLVDYGEGWYHLDTTPQHDYLQVFMLTDKEVEEYTVKTNRNYYTYDKSLYPERGK